MNSIDGRKNNHERVFGQSLEPSSPARARVEESASEKLDKKRARPPRSTRRRRRRRLARTRDLPRRRIYLEGETDFEIGGGARERSNLSRESRQSSSRLYARVAPEPPPVIASSSRRAVASLARASTRRRTLTGPRAVRFATRGAGANARTLEMERDAESMAWRCDVPEGRRDGEEAGGRYKSDYCCGCGRMNTAGFTVGDSGCD